jgi:hypothetical protein
MAQLGKKSGSKKHIKPSQYGSGRSVNVGDGRISDARSGMIVSADNGKMIIRLNNSGELSSAGHEIGSKEVVYGHIVGSGELMKLDGSIIMPARSKGVVLATINSTFSNDAFATKAGYDRSVDSVVARIRSGHIRARQPDED